MNSSPRNSPPPAAFDDRRIELIIGNLLRTGVLLSATVVILGGILYLVRHGHATAAYSVFHGDISTLRSLTGVARGLSHLSGRAIIQLGLLLLIATPVARVVFSAIAFARQRDYLYVAFTLAVLAILTYSLLGAHLR